MAGTNRGGRAAAETNREKYGPDFYAIIGHRGGKKGRTGGFYVNRDLARTAGALGGSRSVRTVGHVWKKEKLRKSRELEQAWKHLQKIHNEAMKEKKAMT